MFRRAFRSSETGYGAFGLKAESRPPVAGVLASQCAQPPLVNALSTGGTTGPTIQFRVVRVRPSQWRADLLRFEHGPRGTLEVVMP